MFDSKKGSFPIKMKKTLGSQWVYILLSHPLLFLKPLWAGNDSPDIKIPTQEISHDDILLVNDTSDEGDAAAEDLEDNIAVEEATGQGYYVRLHYDDEGNLLEGYTNLPHFRDRPLDNDPDINIPLGPFASSLKLPDFDALLTTLKLFDIEPVVNGNTVTAYIPDNLFEVLQVFNNDIITGQGRDTVEPGTGEPGTDGPGTGGPGTDGPGTDGPGTGGPGGENTPPILLDVDVCVNDVMDGMAPDESMGSLVRGSLFDLGMLIDPDTSDTHIVTAINGSALGDPITLVDENNNPVGQLTILASGEFEVSPLTTSGVTTNDELNALLEDGQLQPISVDITTQDSAGNEISSKLNITFKGVNDGPDVPDLVNLLPGLNDEIIGGDGLIDLGDPLVAPGQGGVLVDLVDPLDPVIFLPGDGLSFEIVDNANPFGLSLEDTWGVDQASFDQNNSLGLPPITLPLTPKLQGMDVDTDDILTFSFDRLELGDGMFGPLMTNLETPTNNSTGFMVMDGGLNYHAIIAQDDGLQVGGLRLDPDPTNSNMSMLTFTPFVADPFGLLDPTPGFDIGAPNISGPNQLLVGNIHYTVTDLGGKSDSGIAQFRIAGQNEAPVANPDDAMVFAGQSVDINVLLNDGDFENQTLTITSFSLVGDSQLVQNPDGTIKFTATPSTIPAPDVGDVPNVQNFSYTIEDSFGASSTANVSVLIKDPFLFDFTTDNETRELGLFDPTVHNFKLINLPDLSIKTLCDAIWFGVEGNQYTMTLQDESGAGVTGGLLSLPILEGTTIPFRLDVNGDLVPNGSATYGTDNVVNAILGTLGSNTLVGTMEGTELLFGIFDMNNGDVTLSDTLIGDVQEWEQIFSSTSANFSNDVLIGYGIPEDDTVPGGLYGDVVTATLGNAFGEKNINFGDDCFKSPAPIIIDRNPGSPFAQLEEAQNLLNAAIADKNSLESQQQQLRNLESDKSSIEELLSSVQDALEKNGNVEEIIKDLFMVLEIFGQYNGQLTEQLSQEINRQNEIGINVQDFTNFINSDFTPGVTNSLNELLANLNSITDSIAVLDAQIASQEQVILELENTLGTAEDLFLSSSVGDAGSFGWVISDVDRLAKAQAELAAAQQEQSNLENQVELSQQQTAALDGIRGDARQASAILESGDPASAAAGFTNILNALQTTFNESIDNGALSRLQSLLEQPDSRNLFEFQELLFSVLNGINIPTVDSINQELELIAEQISLLEANVEETTQQIEEARGQPLLSVMNNTVTFGDDCFENGTFVIGDVNESVMVFLNGTNLPDSRSGRNLQSLTDPLLSEASSTEFTGNTLNFGHDTLTGLYNQFIGDVVNFEINGAAGRGSFNIGDDFLTPINPKGPVGPANPLSPIAPLNPTNPITPVQPANNTLMAAEESHETIVRDNVWNFGHDSAITNLQSLQGATPLELAAIGDVDAFSLAFGTTDLGLSNANIGDSHSNHTIVKSNTYNFGSDRLEGIKLGFGDVNVFEINIQNGDVVLLEDTIGPNSLPEGAEANMSTISNNIFNFGDDEIIGLPHELLVTSSGFVQETGYVGDANEFMINLRAGSAPNISGNIPGIPFTNDIEFTNNQFNFGDDKITGSRELYGDVISLSLSIQPSTYAIEELQEVDIDGDGNVDYYITDFTGDGNPDLLVDTNGDGALDLTFIPTSLFNQDIIGFADVDADGIPELYLVERDRDGEPEYLALSDTDEFGEPDTVPASGSFIDFSGTQISFGRDILQGYSTDDLLVGDVKNANFSDPNIDRDGGANAEFFGEKFILTDESGGQRTFGIGALNELFRPDGQNNLFDLYFRYSTPEMVDPTTGEPIPANNTQMTFGEDIFAYSLADNAGADTIQDFRIHSIMTDHLVVESDVLFFENLNNPSNVDPISLLQTMVIFDPDPDTGAVRLSFGDPTDFSITFSGYDFDDYSHLDLAEVTPLNPLTDRDGLYVTLDLTRTNEIDLNNLPTEEVLIGNLDPEGNITQFFPEDDAIMLYNVPTDAFTSLGLANSITGGEYRPGSDPYVYIIELFGGLDSGGVNIGVLGSQDGTPVDVPFILDSDDDGEGTTTVNLVLGTDNTDETLPGTESNDILVGFEGMNQYLPSPGDDHIIPGPDMDNALFSADLLHLQARSFINAAALLDPTDRMSLASTISMGSLFGYNIGLFTNLLTVADNTPDRDGSTTIEVDTTTAVINRSSLEDVSFNGDFNFSYELYNSELEGSGIVATPSNLNQGLYVLGELDANFSLNLNNAADDVVIGGDNTSSGETILVGIQGNGDDVVALGDLTGGGITTVMTDSGNDVLLGGDLLSDGTYTLDGGDEDDILVGGSISDGVTGTYNLNGGGGDDYLKTGDNNSSLGTYRLDGGAGNDVYDLGEGVVTLAFALDNTFGFDIAKGFDGDILEFSNVPDLGQGTALDNLKAATEVLESVNGDAVLEVNYSDPSDPLGAIFLGTLTFEGTSFISGMNDLTDYVSEDAISIV